MAIDIFSIEPHKVSRSLEGYTVMFYGEPKTGKTTTAAKFPKAILLAFETGFLAIPGVKPQPINKWSEFKQVIKQLKDERAHEIYSNVIVDTADIAYDLCEKYICNQEGVSSISEIPYGQGWSKASREFDECLRSIPQMGYGLVMISHSQDKTFKDEQTGEEYNQIVPTLGNKPRLIVDRMSDIIGYARPVERPDGTTKTVLYMRGTPRFVAGSRFKYTPDKIDFSYENLVNAIREAIDKQAEESGDDSVTDEKTTAHEVAPEYDFDELMSEFHKMIAQIQDATGDDFAKKWAPKITNITDKYLGKGKKVNDCTADQIEQLVLIVDDLKEAVGEGL